MPEKLPAHIVYNEGDEGLTLDERWREHWAPRPVWDSLHTNSPAVITEMPDVPYLPDQVCLSLLYDSGVLTRSFSLGSSQTMSSGSTSEHMPQCTA